MANWPQPVSFPIRRNSSGDSKGKGAQVNGGGLRLQTKGGRLGDTENANRKNTSLGPQVASSDSPKAVKGNIQ